MDISKEEPRVRPGRSVPARWGFEVQFPIRQDGSPNSVRALLEAIVAAANARSHFMYRIDDDGTAFFFVPTQTRDRRGQTVTVTPLLDRQVTIPPSIRSLAESASLATDRLFPPDRDDDQLLSEWYGRNTLGVGASPFRRGS